MINDLQRMIEKIPTPGYLACASRPANTLRALTLSLRPHQWVKNSLIFGGLIFSRSLLHWEVAWLSISGFVTFCLASSGVYLLNDLCDIEADRRHPTKRLRPLAAGELCAVSAGVTMAVLLIGSTLAALSLGRPFSMVLWTYLVLNVAYSAALKRVVILDVMAVATGFVLRAVAGAVVIGVQPSPWLILCTLMLALLVGFGKRRHELSLLRVEARNHRASLAGYSIQFLDHMMGIAGASAVVMYALYTMAPETVARFGTNHLVVTTPWVIYGVLRYLYLVHEGMDGADPAHLFLTDRPTLVNVCMWVLVVCLILYVIPGWHPW
jgi:4-hydroxybenzoate polyprenyltransferase